MRVKLSNEAMRNKLIKNTVIDSNTGCWIWVAGTSANYGCVFDGLKDLYAHRASFEYFKAKIPVAKHTMVLHKCGNKLCINPDHLYLGTKADNTCDAVKHGAYKDRKAFSKKEIEFIHNLYSQGQSMRTIAKQLNSNHPRISRVINGGNYAQR